MIIFRLCVLLFMCISGYFQYQMYVYQNETHLINNEVAETLQMVSRQDMLQSAMAMHTNRLLLGIYYKDNAPQEEIYQLIMEREELVRRALQPDNPNILE